jgi:large subunit ribosomal protein L25
MAEKKDYKVQAKVRDGRGKNDARRARRDGMVPITVYGGGAETVAAVAPLRDLAAILRSEAGRNTIFTIEVEGFGESEVMFHDRQIDPVKGRLIHADLTRLVKGQKIEVTVPSKRSRACWNRSFAKSRFVASRARFLMCSMSMFPTWTFTIFYTCLTFR